MIDLHLHLDGSLSLASVRRLAEIQNITVPESDSEVKKLLSVSADCRDLNEYLEKFDFPGSLLQTREGLRLAVKSIQSPERTPQLATSPRSVTGCPRRGRNSRVRSSSKTIRGRCGLRSARLVTRARPGLPTRSLPTAFARTPRRGTGFACSPSTESVASSPSQPATTR